MNNRAGLSRAESRQTRVLAEALLARMDRVPGLSEPALIGKLKRLTEAERSIVLARPNGHEIVTVEDNPTRLRALDQAWTLRQAYPAAQLEVSGRIRVEQLHQIALGVAHLSVPQLRALLAEPEAGPVIDGAAEAIERSET